MEEEGKRQGKEGTTMEAGLLDSIISRLLELRQTRLAKQPQVQLSENEIRQLCAVAKEIFLQQPNLLELEAPGSGERDGIVAPAVQGAAD